jgi:hypothetical protein
MNTKSTRLGTSPAWTGLAKRGRTLATSAAILLGGSSSALACPVCFGAAETHIIDGTRLGVLVLLGITLAVQGAFAAFFLYLRKRARNIADIDLEDEWSRLQSGASKA